MSDGAADTTFPTSRSYANSRKLQAVAHALIPGGAHTYAKGDDQFPEDSPGFMARGQGAHAWDVDGNEFIEYGIGLRSVILGHAYEPVIRAAAAALPMGVNFTRPHQVEVEAAEAVLSLVNQDMIKFAKHGSDVVTAAVKLSRAFTGRDMIAVCGDHPFFAVDDWFIGTTAMNAGIPLYTQLLTQKFKYNDLASLQALFDQFPDKIACVVMEAENTEAPQPGYLQKVQDLCRRKGAVFVMDEIITGFRWHNGGAQAFHGVKPDLCSFGKAMANGFSVSALCGRRDIMEQGGLRSDRKRVFTLSTTHGGETHALAACIATMNEYKSRDVIGTLWRQGKRLQDGVDRIIDSLGIRDYFHLVGRPAALIYVTKDADKTRSQQFRTLFLQEMIKRGVICPNLIVSAAHTDADIDRTIAVVGESLEVYKKALEEGVYRYLAGRPVKPVARAYN
ncbi:glutamate-1-semialdehyde 2,1-aminomutase [Humisphaera borealis]|uniref:Glutamate-1-semialdehyde 2,1-aminomutase n=1 Tax=Humisphaera borealis TaxID=2807512 RepID=A0A7M2WWC9_9BACT|nr:glutamate-1-semialdehyde 2,1-aminomutase [Humisphaera borealis]QOV89713.1 glutamate-1-semialdehyde 2,1-aminomutase [Humisphaera borealis]